MKKPIWVLFIIILLFISNCTKNPESANNTYTVSGFIEYNGLYIENIIVKIDNKLNWTTYTDNNGYFEIQNVLEGNHTLVVSKLLEDGSFSERSNQIAVYNDIELNELKLPKTISLYEPYDITDNSISLKWFPSLSEDFREYKIYRHTTSGLDENTGTLANVSTNRNDTIFTDTNLNPLQNYFYRVFVMNEYGRLGGSNIVNSITKNIEVIKNGNFEIIDPNTNFPLYWYIWNNANIMSIDSVEKHEGKYSIRIDMDNTSPVHHPLYQTIDPNRLTKGDRYHFSYWLKVDSLDDNSGYWVDIASDDWNWAVKINLTSGPMQGFNWQEFTYEFTIPNDIEVSNYLIYFMFEVLSTAELHLTAWIDNVSLEKIN